MTPEEYRTHPGLSQSFLKGFLRSPAHAMRQKPETEAMILGTAAHCAILEPDAFDARYLVIPKVSRATKEGKALWAEAELDGRIILNEEQYGLVKGMRDAVLAHSIASRLLAGEREAPVFWEIDGQPCKGLFDVWNLVDNLIVDIKTTVTAEPASFQRRIWQEPFLYGFQAAWYADGGEIVSQRPQTFAFIAVEHCLKDGYDKPVHGVSVHEVESDAIDRGRRDYHKALAIYRECKRAGRYPAYEEVIYKAHAPKWDNEVETETLDEEDDFNG